jgi:hypothetical protein
MAFYWRDITLMDRKEFSNVPKPALREDAPRDQEIKYQDALHGGVLIEEEKARENVCVT